MTDSMSQISMSQISMTQISTNARPSSRRATKRRAAVVTVVLATVLAGCSSGGGDGPASVPTRVPATPAAAPTTASPIGSSTSMSTEITSLTVDGADRTLLVQSASPDKLEVWRLGAPENNLDGPVLEVDLPKGAGTAVLTADNTALVPTPSGLTVVSLADGSGRDVEVNGAALSVATTPDGRIAVGTDKGSVVILDSELEEERTVTGFVSVDGLVAARDVLVALDTHQTSATEIDPGDGELSGALRVGVGATGIIADHYGRVIVADSDAGQIVVLSVDPLLNRQMGPVGDSPYGLADDVDRNLVWVTLTATNEVVGFDLSSGAPEETFRLPTVQDPRSVAVDQETGDLYIGSAAGRGLQRIGAEDIK